jgi:hypothetical protein
VGSHRVDDRLMRRRRLVLLLVAITLFSAVIVAYLNFRTDNRSSSATAAPHEIPERRIQDAPGAVHVDEQASELVAEESMPSDQTVARWIEEMESTHAETRSAAIVALARAPKALAIPALRRMLEGGDPMTERPLALQSLRDLALYQGDEDGRIRTVVRETIYHSDEGSLVEDAQLALEIIEESEMGEME